MSGPSSIKRARLRLPIRVKLATVSAALTFVILCLFAFVIGAVAVQRIRAGFDDDLRATAADLQDALQSSENLGLQTQGSPQLAEAVRGAAAGGAIVRVVSRNGQVLYPSGALALGPPGIDGVTDVGDYRVVSRPLVSTVETPSLFSPPGPLAAEAVAYVQYAKPEQSVERTVQKVRVFMGLGVLGGTALAFLGGLFVARRAMRPIMGLTRAAREVARTRDPDITLPRSQANDEVADLARTFEDMLRELSAARGETEASLVRQREFVADASHELRTPLTSILANLELLESELSGEQRDMAGSALRSSKRMRRLVADLLLLARADAGRRAPTRPLDLSSVAAEAATEAGALSADHPLSLDLPEPAIVEGAADDLHRLVANLVENALVHTPPGTPVTVSVRRAGDSVLLEVADRGPGVPPEMRRRVFERFARGGGDAAPAGSSGLGLAIVRAVADAHGGRVELRDAEGEGSRFLVTLPAVGDGGAAAPGVVRDKQPDDQVERPSRPT